ncbi:MAG: N-acetylmuramoyl-L-alanine amidase family protein [Oscillospiraceae bacterium]
MKIQQMLLTPNKYSRPQIPLKTVTKIAVHYVGNPNTTAKNNRDYFENQRLGGVYVSSHFIVGLGGEIIQCIPTSEISYCTNEANVYSVSIECCHPDSTGKFTSDTEKSLAELCAYLCEQFGLTAEDIIRHYDVTGKQCPLYWSPTKYQSADIANARFAAFKARVKYIMDCGENVDIAESTDTEVPFCVRVIDPALNIRAAAGVSNKAVGVIRGGGVYTIVETQNVGTAVWGRLKSGAGWINIGEKYCEKV